MYGLGTMLGHGCVFLVCFMLCVLGFVCGPRVLAHVALSIASTRS